MADYIIKVPDSAKNYEPCGCMGKQGNDPHCPCEMRSRGLTPSQGQSRGSLDKFVEALKRG